jgi:hypothetical protein
MARDLEGSFEGKAKLHRRALGTFERVREKLACLSFIDPRIQPVVDSIDDWTARLPRTGPIEGAIFNEGMGLALLLAGPARMARHGGGQLEAPDAKEEEDSLQDDLEVPLVPEPEPRSRREVPEPTPAFQDEGFFF